jgi:hypothetical protein
MRVRVRVCVSACVRAGVCVCVCLSVCVCVCVCVWVGMHIVIGVRLYPCMCRGIGMQMISCLYLRPPCAACKPTPDACVNATCCDVIPCLRALYSFVYLSLSLSLSLTLYPPDFDDVRPVNVPVRLQAQVDGRM